MTARRLLIHVEGQTEEAFVDQILRDHLLGVGFGIVSARLVGNPRRKRGGIRPWEGVKPDVLRHLKEDHSAFSALIVDCYGMPLDWPGRLEAPKRATSSGRGSHVESALIAEISEEMGSSFDMRRFLPLVMMHEFEALLFSDPDGFANGIGISNLAEKFRSVREGFACVEDINDSVTTAPSKRIEGIFPGYQKPLFGTIAALEIGLDKMRQECPHFNEWLTRLEALPGQFA